MFWDDLDEVMSKIFAELFCEDSIALPLKIRHKIYVRNVLKNALICQRTITPIHNRKIIKPKGRAARPFFFRKIYMSYNERTTSNSSGAQLTTAPSPFTRSGSTISNGIKRLLILFCLAKNTSSIMREELQRKQMLSWNLPKGTPSNFSYIFASAHFSGQPRKNYMSYNERVHFSNKVEESAAMQTLLFFFAFLVAGFTRPIMRRSHSITTSL